MNRARLIAAMIVFAAALIGGIGTYLALYVFLPGRVSHEDYLPNNNGLRIVLQPYRVQGRVSDLVPDATRFIKAIPKVMSTQGRPFRIDWIHHLPYEFAILIQQERLDTLGVRLYVNEKPDMKSFVGELNNSGFFGAVRGVVWNPPRVRAQGNTSWLTDGLLSIPAGTQDIVARDFPGADFPDAVSYAGAHFFEMTGVNNAGAFAEFHGAIVRNWGSRGGEDLHDALRTIWPYVDRASLAGDWTATDQMTFTMTLSPGTGGNRADLMQVHDLFLARLDAGLDAWQGMRVSGGAHWENDLLVGHYTLTGFEAALQRALRIR